MSYVITNGSGVATSNVTNVRVNFVTNQYTISGIVSGLAEGESVVLRNGTDFVQVTSNGPFTFPTPVMHGDSYAVEVMESPSAPSEQAYYVSPAGNNTHSGEIGAPWKTIEYGATRLNLGDTLYCRAGSWTDRIFEENFSHSGIGWGVGQFITIAGYPGESVRIRPTWDSIVRFRGSAIHHILLKNLIIDASLDNGHVDCVSLGNDGHNIHLEDCEVVGAWGNGIICDGDSYEFRNLNVHGHGREGILEAQYKHANGAYLACSNSRVIGGRYWDNESYGLRFGTSVKEYDKTGNIVVGIRAYQNGYHLGLGGQSPANGGGIILADSENSAVNNLLYGNEVGLTFYGLTGKTATKLKAYNNTITGNSIGVHVENQSGPVVSAEVINNIIFGNNTAIIDGGQGTVFGSNLQTDPSFVNASAGDYSLRAESAARDAGQSVPVSYDFIGTPRPQNIRHDIGAYEFPMLRRVIQ